MTSFFKLLQWVLKGAVFFTLFAFALGIVVGVLGMVPRWWRHRQLARKAEKANTTAAQAPADVQEPPHGA